MQDQARMFSDDSTKLAKIMRARAWKLRIMVCLVVIAVLLWIIVPIVVSAKK